ncbi:NAD(P)/FAD-dependent oxidoreductase [Synechocystis salina LEGE 06155]|nr:NAD(P)/FAD-dependent oxidoreductase [Synechocystis salina LEGE 06155]
MKQISVVIVGGGLCGLIAGTVLQRQGLGVTVLDKGKGIGGRLASRRLRHGEAVGCFDFGAQYFKAQDPLFLAWVEDWLNAGVVKVWAEGMGTETGAIRSQGVKLYRGELSNRSLAQYLAQDLRVVNGERVNSFHWQDNVWQVHCDSGQVYLGDRLVVTAPLPQTLALCETSAIKLPAHVHQTLAAVTYDPCFSLSLLLEQPSLVPEPGGVWLSGEPLVWMACSTKKGISPHGYGVTVQAGPEFSRHHLETDAVQVIQLMTEAAQPWLGSAVLASHLHLWRYSHPQNPLDQSFLFGNFPGPVYFGGDAFHGGKVEGAALSGLAIAEHLLNSLTKG